MRTTFTLKTVDGKVLELTDLPKVQARKLYAFAQGMEENVREERRTREIEEKRGMAGGVFVQSGIPTPIQMPPQTAKSLSEDPVQTLKKLKEMMDAGLITVQEYEVKKTDILAKM